jgi:hypothetical protein
MRLIEDIVKSLKYYKIITVLLLALDSISFLVSYSIDLAYTSSKSEEYNGTLVTYVMKILVELLLVIALVVLIIKGRKKYSIIITIM